MDLSRDIRFKDCYKDKLLEALGLKSEITVIDIGCGPGTLTRKLSKWLGEKSTVIGIDIDSKFIEYAKNIARDLGINNISYIEGNALKLPLEDNSVDACTSHTVIEHVPNKEFLLEQKRICKTGGTVSVISVMHKQIIKALSKHGPQISQREKELWKIIDEYWEEEDKNREVDKYEMKPIELPLLFEQLGFHDIKIDALAIPTCIDDCRNSMKDRIAIIESERAMELEALEIGIRQVPYKLPKEDIEELRSLIESRFARRIDMIDKGKAIWDFTVVTLIIVSGRK
nr:class I SAM-dependent methyltransferase [Clostridium punense]